jgi:hypothetical protein
MVGRKCACSINNIILSAHVPLSTPTPPKHGFVTTVVFSMLNFQKKKQWIPRFLPQQSNIFHTYLSEL